MVTSELEVNTDLALIDFDLEGFAEDHERRFGLAIAYVKNLVRGTNYRNKAMDFVVGRRGFYAQSRHFPAAFYGETFEGQLASVGESEAQAACWEAVAHYRAGEAQSVTCVYSAEPTDVFFGYRVKRDERFELGLLKGGLPLHLRVMIDAPKPSSLLDHRKGAFIYHRSRAGKHLLLKAPGRRQPFPLLDGFGE